jgi:AcrR family transcriptional regulator
MDGDREAEGAECCGPRKRDKEAAKRALLDAARAVFAERGFDAATTREVAARAGLNEQLIQRYFGGKAGLLSALFERYGREEAEGACALPPPAGGLEAELASFLSFQVERTWRCRDLAKVAMDRALVDPGAAREMAETVSGCRVPALVERLEAFRARGEIGPCHDLRAVAEGVATLSFGLGFLDRVVFDRCQNRGGEVVRTLAGVLARGLASKD